jgi:hypothetical protein
MRCRARMPALVAIVMILVAVGPPAVTADSAEAEATRAATTWLALVDTGRFEESWRQAATLFRQAVTSAQWQQSVSAARRPFGKLLSREVVSAKYATSLPGAPDGEYVVIQFRAAFEHKKEAIETVTPMRDSADKRQWRVSGYYIR